MRNNAFDKVFKSKCKKTHQTNIETFIVDVINLNKMHPLKFALLFL